MSIFCLSGRVESSLSQTTLSACRRLVYFALFFFVEFGYFLSFFFSFVFDLFFCLL